MTLGCYAWHWLITASQQLKYQRISQHSREQIRMHHYLYGNVNILVLCSEKSTHFMWIFGKRSWLQTLKLNVWLCWRLACCQNDSISVCFMPFCDEWGLWPLCHEFWEIFFRAIISDDIIEMISGNDYRPRTKKKMNLSLPRL